ncbi:hypothetical protein PTKU46_79790 [Paraburkholderia terrae]
MYAAEPLISCADHTVALLFHVRQEQADHLRGEIINGQAVDPLVDLGGQIRKQRHEHVAVTSLRIDGKVTFADQILDQEAPDPRTRLG